MGDSVQVQPFGRAALLLPDATIFRLDQNTTVTFMPPRDRARSWLEVLRGAVHIISRDPTSFEVSTPFANAGIDGTEFLVVVGDEETTITVFEGAVTVGNAAGEVRVVSGQRAVARTDQRPLLTAVVRPRDAVQWTLHYAPVLGRALPRADEAPRAGQVADPSFYTARAASRLGVGRVDEAQADIAQALSLDQDNVEALSLQSIIALTQNDKDEALRLADLAVARDPTSSSALTALSYARQAFFDISGALAALQEAVERDARNALAWARVSELWLAVGDLEQGLAAAQTAVSLDPGVARTQTVLGFAYLTQVRTEEAGDAFERAIDLDQGAPLPRLGLGLALIRSGELAAGREAMESAVILDPGNALIRSYMGKAYYDEHRNELAESQFEMAKALDPFEPTPWFYDAIRKQTLNRPVEGLQDLEQSIALNDNRAVYRSRLLLDEDFGARSASLGRIFTDLGFERLAVLEGAKSVNVNPANYSGHRLLADTYAALPRHEIARANELFQSQLLQPLNVTPIPPQLAESNIFILDSAGPAEISFNEFNPAFNRNRTAFQASGVAGGNDTWGEDITVAGVLRRFSYSVGQFHFETDGFRENNDLEQDVLNAFFQFRPSPATSVLAEVRRTERSQGDLNLYFDKQNYLPDLRSDEETESVRVGLRRRLSPRSNLLASLVSQSADLIVTSLPNFSFASELNGYTAELQHLFVGDRWRQSSGVRYTNRDDDQIIFQSLPPFVMESTTMDSVNTENINAYSYAQFGATDRLGFVLGASADYLDGPTIEDDRINPKAGLIWEPRDDTTFRAAAFRTIQYPTFSRQDIQPRLEPTQVVGFNQLYFGSEGEEVVHTAFAYDRRLSPSLYLGAEIVERDVEVPFVRAEDPPGIGLVTVVEEAEERFGRGYVYWMPDTRIAVAFEYQYDRLRNENEDFVPQGFARLTTHRIPMQLSYFAPSGLNLKLVATFVDQDGVFSNPNPPFVNYSDADAFWVFDASAGYRLPRRRGIVTLSIRNALDEEFNFQDVDPENPRIVPERLVLMRFTFAI